MLLDILKKIRLLQKQRNTIDLKQEITPLNDKITQAYGATAAGYLCEVLTLYGLIPSSLPATDQRDLATKILPLCQLAYLEENNGHPEAHAQKLSFIFLHEETILTYLIDYASTNRYKFLVHDACLFDVNTDDINWFEWQRLANKKDMMSNPRFRELLPHAKHIEQLLKKTNLTKPDLPVIKALKKEVQQQHHAYQQLLKSPVANQDTHERKRKLKALSTERANKRLALAQQCSGLPWCQVDLAILIACYECYQQHNKAHQALIKHGISDKSIAEFECLPRTNDNTLIPDIVIDGRDLGYPNYLLRKLDPTQERDAAIAAILGKLTDCCQYLGGAGDACAKHGISAPGSGFYVLFMINDKPSPMIIDDAMQLEADHDEPELEVAAQAWVWRHDHGLCFDSIETNNKVSNAIATDMYRYLAHWLVHHTNHPLTHTNVGARSGISASIGLKNYVSRKLSPQGYCGYSDAHSQLLLSDKQRPYLHYGQSSSLLLNQRIEQDFLAWLSSTSTMSNSYNDNDELKQLIAFSLSTNNTALLQQTQQIFGLTNEAFNQLIDVNRKFLTDLNNNKVTLDYLSQGAYAHMMNEEGQTPLHLAVLAVDLTLINALLPYKMPTIYDQDNNTPLLLALDNIGYQNNNPKGKEIAQLLIHAGADLNVKNKKCNTPLMIAVHHHDIDMVKTLVTAGADLEQYDDEFRTAVYCAAQLGHEDIFSYLLTYKPNLNLTSQHTQNTLLMAATMGGNSDIVKVLLADLTLDFKKCNTEGKTVFHLAVERERADLVALFLAAGGAINTKNSTGNTALHYAVYRYSMTMVDFLIAQGADIEAVNNDHKTPIHIAAEIKNISAFNCLFALKVNLTNVSKNGDNLLMAAISANQIDMVKTLLTTQAFDLTKQGNLNKTVYHLAVNNNDIMQLLLSHDKAAINYQDKFGQTALFLAVVENQLATAKTLINHSADINCRNNNNETPIFYAACHRYIELFDYLLQQNARLDAITNNSGDNILIAACKSGYCRIVDIVDRLLSKQTFALNYQNNQHETAVFHAFKSPDTLALLYSKNDLLLSELMASIFTPNKSGFCAISFAIDKPASLAWLLERLSTSEKTITKTHVYFDQWVSLLINAISKQKKEVVSLLMTQLVYDFDALITDHNILFEAIKDDAILAMVLAKIPASNVGELLLKPDDKGFSPLFECGQHGYRASLERLLNCLPAEQRLETVLTHVCTPKNSYYISEKSLFLTVMTWVEFLRTLPAADLYKVTKMTIKDSIGDREKEHSFFSRIICYPDSLELCLSVYPPEERLSTLAIKDYRFYTVFSRKESVNALINMLPYNDLTNLLQFKDSTNSYKLIDSLSDINIIKLIFKALTLDDVLTLLQLKNDDHMMLLFKDKLSITLLQLIPESYRYDISIVAIESFFNLLKKSHFFGLRWNNQYDVFTSMITLLPVAQRDLFLKKIEPEHKDFILETIEHTIDFIDLISPDYTFELLQTNNKSGDTFFHDLSYRIKLKTLEKILAYFSADQCFDLLMAKNERDNLITATQFKDKPLHLVKLLDKFSVEQQQLIIRAANYFRKPLLYFTTQEPTLFQRLLTFYPPIERLTLLTTDVDMGETLLHKMINNPITLTIALELLPERDQSAYLSLRIFGYNVGEVIAKGLPVSCKYTLNNDYFNFLLLRDNDTRYRFFRNKDGNAKATKLLLYTFCSLAEPDDTVYQAYVGKLFPNEVLARKEVLLRLKQRWDFNLPAVALVDEVEGGSLLLS